MCRYHFTVLRHAEIQVGKLTTCSSEDPQLDDPQSVYKPVGNSRSSGTLDNCRRTHCAMEAASASFQCQSCPATYGKLEHLQRHNLSVRRYYRLPARWGRSLTSNPSGQTLMTGLSPARFVVKPSHAAMFLSATSRLAKRNPTPKPRPA